MKLLLLIFLSYFILWLRPVCAETMQISQIELGKVITIDGRQFVKIRDDPVKGSQFIALQSPCMPNVTPYFTGTMQAFATADCNSMPTPVGTCYVYVGTLADARDGKSYEIRRFADGRCWMVDNLAYGGASDACANKTSFSGAGSPTATNRFGAGTYGDCRDPSAAGGACLHGDCDFCATGAGAGKCGYYYNWQAAMQETSTYYGNSYQPTLPAQGICPVGWHIPLGAKYFGEFQILHSSTHAGQVGFWQPGGNWKGVYSGFCNEVGDRGGQNGTGFNWASSQWNLNEAYNVSFHYRGTSQEHALDKNYGSTIRCIKD